VPAAIGANDAVELHCEVPLTPHVFGPFGAWDGMFTLTPLVIGQEKLFVAIALMAQIPLKLLSLLFAAVVPFKNCAIETTWPTSQVPPVIVCVTV